jgi:threonine dehydratase
MWAVETQGADILAQSLAAGEQLRMTPTSRAKTLGSPYAAQTAIDLATQLAETPIVVSDEAAYRSMQTIMERTKVVPELAASCTLTAAESVAHRFGSDDHVVLLMCGGNISGADIADMGREFG